MFYDFVIRTRPDVLYNAVDVAPNTWPLWNDRKRNSASGFVKCDHDHLGEPGMKLPVRDVLFVGPRRVAKIFMTTWSRREMFLPGAQMKMFNDCWMYQDERDAFECLTIVDLRSHGFDMEAIPNQVIVDDAKCASSKWQLNNCEMPHFSPTLIWHYFSKELQACIMRGRSP